jgi:NADPH:quinone reductase-like Zn-dependent oxidoreductase
LRAALFHEFGGPDVVVMGEVPRPEAGPGEVLLRVVAAGMNHLDLWIRRGLPIETTMPHIGGSDVAGVVEALGEGVSGFQPGDPVVVDPSLSCGRCEWCLRGEAPLCTRYRILGEHTQGGFAEYVTVPAANLYAIPSDFDFDRAAASPLPFLTAWRGLITRARLRAGETALITGASGGVGTAAVQIAKLAGARVFAVTTAANVDRVHALGADVVYDRESVEYAKEVWRDTSKRGVDVVFDSVGEATWGANVRAVARGGRIVVYGATTGPRGETDLRQLFWKQIEIIGTTMSNPTEFRTVMDLVVSGVLAPVIDVVWPLERARAAHERLEAGRQFGKIVLRP